MTVIARPRTRVLSRQLDRLGALSFSGSNVVNHGSDASLDDLTAATYIALAYPTTPPAAITRIMGKGTATDFYFGTSHAQMILWTGATTGASVRATPGNFAAWGLNRWLLLAASFRIDGPLDEHALYMGSRVVPAAPPSSYDARVAGAGTRTSDAANDLTVGNNAGGTTPWAGRISRLVIFPRVLTLPEIREVQESIFSAIWTPPGEPRLNASYGLRTGRQFDESGYRNHGTITGASRAVGPRFQPPRTRAYFVPPPVVALIDNFDDNAVDTAKWDAITDGTPGATLAETGGKLRITPTLNEAGGDYASLRSDVTWDLTGKRYYVQVPLAIGGSSVIQQFAITLARTSSGLVPWQNALVWWKEGSAFFVKGYSAGSTVANKGISYIDTTHRYWAIREAAGVIYWETSPDRTTWTVQHSMTAPWAVTAVYVELRAGTFGSSSNATACEFDGLNTEANNLQVALPTLQLGLSPETIYPPGAAPQTIPLSLLQLGLDLGTTIGIAPELPTLQLAFELQPLVVTLNGALAIDLPVLQLGLSLDDILIPGQNIQIALDDPLELGLELQPLTPPNFIDLPVLQLGLSLQDLIFTREDRIRRRRASASHG